MHVLSRIHSFLHAHPRARILFVFGGIHQFTINCCCVPQLLHRFTLPNPCLTGPTLWPPPLACPCVCGCRRNPDSSPQPPPNENLLSSLPLPLWHTRLCGVESNATLFTRACTSLAWWVSLHMVCLGRVHVLGAGHLEMHTYLYTCTHLDTRTHAQEKKSAKERRW